MNKISYKIKSLAQKLPRQGMITPGVYEFEDLGTEVIEYQKKLKNLVEISVEEKVADKIDLKLRVEDEIQQPQTIKRNRKTRRNINDNSN